jgi:hypothetical protein
MTLIEETCPCCKQPCYLSIIDDGIGHYEFWGMPGYDSRLLVVSDCCNAEIDGYSPEDLKEDDYI